MTKYRTQLRNYNFDTKSNCGYNLITGEPRVGVVVTKPDFVVQKDDPMKFGQRK